MAEHVQELADIVVAFLSKLCHTKGEWAGKPFNVLSWQENAISRFYGTVEEDERGELVRAFHYLYLEIPKKNGKTELSAGLGLYHLLCDGEQGAEVYLCAADKENASICFNAICYMLENVPSLRKLKLKGVLKVSPSQKVVRYPKTGSILRVLSSDHHSKHGYSPSCVIFDELHAQPNRQLWDVMTGAAGSARRQPVWIVLTTAGDDPDRKSIGWEVHEKCRKLLALREGHPENADDEDDPLWCPIMYGISAITGDSDEKIEALDIYDENIWYQCNPSLGETISIRAMRQEARTARTSEAAERLFRWLRLNQWIADAAVGWLPVTLYDRTQWHVPELEERMKGMELRAAMREWIRGKECYIGIDLSTTTDLTAITLEFPPQRGLNQTVVLFHAWRPKEGVVDAEKRDHVPYRDWERAGYLTLCDGDIIDYTMVLDYIRHMKSLYKIKRIGIDPYMSRSLTPMLSEIAEVVEIPQGIRNISPPMKDLERCLRSGTMRHEHNTAARWCFGNVKIFVDDNENIKATKKRSFGRIDITISWIIAHATYLLDEPEETVSSLVEAGTFSF